MTVILNKVIKEYSDEELLNAYQRVNVININIEKQDKIFKENQFKDRKAKTFSKSLARKRLIDFCMYTQEDYDVNEHHEIIAEHLDLWSLGIIPKLIVVTPPRCGKSEISSRKLPAKILGDNPDANIMNITHTASLAREFNRDVQRIIDSDEYKELYPNTKLGSTNVRANSREPYRKNSDIFDIVGHKGSYLSAGIHSGNIMGKGTTHLILDDLVSGPREAISKVSRNSIWEVYQSSLARRVAKNGKILFLTTRWHEDDTVGRLLKKEKGQWVVLNFPMIKTTALNENDYDFRDVGEILWENRYSLEDAIEIRSNTSLYWWSALFQGSPTPEGGSTIKEEWFVERYDELPPYKEWIRIVQSWDTAFEEKETNDFSVCSTWLETKKRYYLVHVWRDRPAFPALKKKAKELYDKFNPPGEIGMEVLIEKKASGHSLIQELRDGKIPVKAIEVDRSKKIRLEVASPIIAAGKVVLPNEAPWLDVFLEEIVQGLHGAFDDQIDTMTQAINHMKGNKGYEDFLERLGEEMENRSSGNMYEKIQEEDWQYIEDIDEEDKEHFDDIADEDSERSNAYDLVIRGNL